MGTLYRITGQSIQKLLIHWTKKQTLNIMMVQGKLITEVITRHLLGTMNVRPSNSWLTDQSTKCLHFMLSAN